jgi:hypothetical protein
MLFSQNGKFETYFSSSPPYGRHASAAGFRERGNKRPHASNEQPPFVLIIADAATIYAIEPLPRTEEAAGAVQSSSCSKEEEEQEEEEEEEEEQEEQQQQPQ